MKLPICVLCDQVMQPVLEEMRFAIPKAKVYQSKTPRSKCKRIRNKFKKKYSYTVYTSSQLVLKGVKCDPCRSKIAEGMPNFSDSACFYPRELELRVQFLKKYNAIMSNPEYKLPEGYSMP